jgi:hypothetical protein
VQCRELRKTGADMEVMDVAFSSAASKNVVNTQWLKDCGFSNLAAV